MVISRAEGAPVNGGAKRDRHTTRGSPDDRIEAVIVEAKDSVPNLVERAPDRQRAPSTRMMTQRRSTVHKSEAFTELHAMINSRLFGRHPWLIEGEACAAVNRKLHDLGLDKVVPGEPGATRATNFGREHHPDLIDVFLGVFDECDLLLILKRYGLIDELEVDELFDRESAPRSRLG